MPVVWLHDACRIKDRYSPLTRGRKPSSPQLRTQGGCSFPKEAQARPIHPGYCGDAAMAVMGVCALLGANHSNRTPCERQY